MDFDQISNSWKIENKLYDLLGKRVVAYIKKEIGKYEILPEVTFRTKDLISIVKKIKKKNLEKSGYSFSDLKDKLGVRIICAFNSDLNIVDEFLKANFEIEKAEYKNEALDFNKLDYISNHYDIKIGSKKKLRFKDEKIKDLIFEVQVRSLNQHAWSNTAHFLTYKRESDISNVLKRRVYRLLSLYEIADDEFSSVNRALIEQENNLVYTILRKLEGKIYRYANIDFDRESSLMNISIIINSLEIRQREKLINGIGEFIQNNEQKIIKIFKTNRHRFYKLSYITQPEIFIIWFCLENFLFTIEGIYANEFDEDELEQIKAIWG